MAYCSACLTELDIRPVRVVFDDFVKVRCGSCEKINNVSLLREFQKVNYCD